IRQRHTSNRPAWRHRSGAAALVEMRRRRCRGTPVSLEQFSFVILTWRESICGIATRMREPDAHPHLHRPASLFSEEQICRKKRLSKEPRKTKRKGSRRAPRLVSSFVKRCTTFAKASTARNRRSRRSRSVSRKHGGRA